MKEKASACCVRNDGRRAWREGEKRIPRFAREDIILGLGMTYWGARDGDFFGEEVARG